MRAEGTGKGMTLTRGSGRVATQRRARVARVKRAERGRAAGCGAGLQRGDALAGPQGKEAGRLGRGPGLSASWPARGEGEAGGWAVRERVGRTGLSCWVGFWVSYWVSIFLFFSTLFLKQTNKV